MHFLFLFLFFQPLCYAGICSIGFSSSHLGPSFSQQFSASFFQMLPQGSINSTLGLPSVLAVSVLRVALLGLCSGILNIPPTPPPQEAAWSFQEILWLPLLISTIYNPARKGNIASPSALYLQSKGNVRVSDSWLAPNPHPPHSGSLRGGFQHH